MTQRLIHQGYGNIPCLNAQFGFFSYLCLCKTRVCCLYEICKMPQILYVATVIVLFIIPNLNQETLQIFISENIDISVLHDIWTEAQTTPL